MGYRDYVELVKLEHLLSRKRVRFGFIYEGVDFSKLALTQVRTYKIDTDDDVIGFIAEYKANPIYVKYSKSERYMIYYTYKDKKPVILNSMIRDLSNYCRLAAKFEDNGTIGAIADNEFLEIKELPEHKDKYFDRAYYGYDREFDYGYGGYNEEDYIKMESDIKKYGTKKCPICGRYGIDMIGSFCPQCHWDIDFTSDMNDFSVLNQDTAYDYKKRYDKMFKFKRKKKKT